MSRIGEMEELLYLSNMASKRIFIAITILMMTVSCGKQEQPSNSGVPISFGVSTMQVQTKGISLTKDDLASRAMVIVNAKEGNDNIIYNNRSDLRIKPESNSSNNWFPVWNISDANGNNNWKDWNTNQHSYTFLAYAYSPTNATNNNTLLKINSTATDVTIHQPKTYSYLNESTTMVDYLLSHRVSADGAKKPVVNLLFEHALSMVEIYVIRDETISDVEVKSLSLRGFYTDMNLKVNGDVATTNSAYTEWNNVTIENTTRDGDYTLDGSTNVFSTVTNQDDMSFEARYGTETGKEQRPAIIRAITVPQSLQAKTATEDGTRLTVSFRVNQAPNNQTADWSSELTKTFQLVANDLPTAWKPGYKYIYVIKIDTGVHFTAKVMRWLDGGNIEATILPEIKDESTNNQGGQS